MQKKPNLLEAEEAVAANPIAAIQGRLAGVTPDAEVLAAWLWRSAQIERQHWADEAEGREPAPKRGFAWLCSLLGEQDKAASLSKARREAGVGKSLKAGDRLLLSMEGLMLSHRAASQDPRARTLARAFNQNMANEHWAGAAEFAAHPAFDWFARVRRDKDTPRWHGFFPGVAPGPENGAASPIQMLVSALLLDATRERVGLGPSAETKHAGLMLAPLAAIAQRDALASVADQAAAEGQNAIHGDLRAPHRAATRL
jgi:hypothetical protein